ncbi:MAG: DNA translocase FtsK [Muribaculaceae bacterium]|nr:DNA translocase FtsK [Muribaculaceae bacterium]
MTDRNRTAQSFDDYELGMGGAPVRPRPQDRNTEAKRNNEKRTKYSQERPKTASARDNTRTRTGGATTKRPAPARKPAQPKYGLKDFFTDYRTHLACGIILCVIAVVMVGVSVSFFFNGQLDQSITHGRSITEIEASGDEVGNAGGIVGARLAKFLMVDTLGIGSFILALYIFLIGLRCMRAVKLNIITLTFKSLYSAVAISLIMGLLTFHSEGFFHLGGNHGYYINDMIQRFSGGLGAYAVAVVLFGGLVAIYLHPLQTFFRAAIATFRGVKSKLPENLGEKVSSIVKPSPVNISSLDEAEGEPAHSVDTEMDEDEVEEEVEAEEEVETAPEAEEQQETEEIAQEFDAPDINVLGEGEAEEESAEEEIETDEIPFTVNLPKAPDTAQSSPVLTITNMANGEDDVHELPDEGPEINDGDHLGLDTIYDHKAELGNFKAPKTGLLIERPASVPIDEEEQEKNKNMIVEALRSFGVEIAEVKATVGPTVTLFEIVPDKGVKISRIKNLEDDIAMNLAAQGIRIIAPMPGKGTIGIEVPNASPQIVGIRTVLESEAYQRAKAKMALPMALGATISNDIFIADLTKMPHLLVAGATGQGKSVGLNTIIMSLIYAKHPSELKFVLIDPKRVEFSVYKALENHYMAKLPDEDNPIITDPMKAVTTLQSLCEEMEARYDLLSTAGVRDIAKYNERFCQRRLDPHKGHRYLPYIVIIVDEFADLTMVAGKDVSLPIARIAQKARAVGMHMILATQRPSTDVITGMIKANFPGRIGFRVQQMVDSRTILDAPGANRLIGRGDMLFSNSGQMDRVQCALVETEEIEAVVDHISEQIGYQTAYPLPEPPATDGAGGLVELGGIGGSGEVSKKDETFMMCARFVGTQSVTSTSMLQRKFKIGFNRAGRIMEDLQTLGIVGPPNGNNPRQVQMTSDEVEQVLSNL